jgi:3-methyl-2-oxobutanoate hydroxymethyltransferase
LFKPVPGSFRTLPETWAMSTAADIKRITTNTLQKMKASGKKIAMLTAYDFSFAKLFDEAGIDVIL